MHFSAQLSFWGVINPYHISFPVFVSTALLEQSVLFEQEVAKTHHFSIFFLAHESRHPAFPMYRAGFAAAVPSTWCISTSHVHLEARVHSRAQAASAEASGPVHWGSELARELSEGRGLASLGSGPKLAQQTLVGPDIVLSAVADACRVYWDQRLD